MKMDLLKRKIYEDMERISKNRSDIVMRYLSTVDTKVVDITKNVLLSRKAKAEGDKLSVEEKHNCEHQHKILCLYNESIAYAPLESEDVAKSYANKSALLRRMRRYAECISEADKALKITQSTPLKIKLMCRKADCHTALDSPENRVCLEKAKFILNKSQDSDLNKKALLKLIKKTQLVIDENKLDIPQDTKKVLQSSEMVSKVSSLDYQSLIKVEYSEKYGFHLVAARDFQPGELILVERPYRSYLEKSKMYQYCYHCLNYLWTVVPCSHCNVCEFCSEKCKNESWNKYHELECFCLSHMKALMGYERCLGYLVLSIFFKALKEAGSMNKLRADIEMIDKNEGQWAKNLPPNGESVDYRIVCSLPAIKIEEFEFHRLSENCIICLMALAKYTKIFGIINSYCEVEKLMKNDTAIFVGGLLLRLRILILNRCVPYFLADPTTRIDKNFNVNDSTDNFCFNTLPIMTITNCVSNVKIGVTRDHLCAWNSIRSIKKGDKLVVLDVRRSIFTYSPKSERQLMHQKSYNWLCDCQACEEDWTTDDLKTFKVDDVPESEDLIRGRIRGEFVEYYQKRNTTSSKPGFPDVKVLYQVRDLVSRAWEYFDMPSPIPIISVRLLIEVLAKFYDFPSIGEI